MGKTIAIASRKGGVGKTTTAISLAAGLAQQGKRVLALDLDPQGSLTTGFGIQEPDAISTTIGTVMTSIINDAGFDRTVIKHTEGADILPANNSLAGVELALVQTMGREGILRQYISEVKKQYDYLIIDCSPNLGLLTVSALAAADSVIIPVCPRFLDAKGLESLLKTIAQIRRQINPTLEIGGILLTMVDRRAKFTREVISSIEEAYGGSIKIFGEHIPRSVRVTEASASGVSVLRYDPNGRVAAAYAALVREVLADVE